MKHCVIVLAFFICCISVSFAEDTSVVARIGEQKITMADFNRWVSYNPEAGREALLKDNKKKANMLHQIITGMVIADIARKEKFDTRPDIREKMDHMINNFLTLEYLDKVVSARVTAPEEDILAYYKKNSDRFMDRKKISARHILIKTGSESSTEERAGARAKAEGLLKRIRDGENFESLAREFSDDGGSKEQGGSLGWFSRGRMVREFDQVAFSLEPGQVSDIVETKFGYHIIRVDERKEPAPKPLEQVRSSIEEKVTREKRRDAVDEFVKKAMDEADVDINIGTLVGSDPHFRQ